MENDNYSESMTEEKVTHREYIRSTAEINKLSEIACIKR